LGNGTYIVEGDTSLVLIDSHFTDESAQAFRDYADSIGKPIDRIYVTHEHPDHINGLVTVFADIDSYAPSSVAEEFDTVANTQEAGTLTIDGINYEFEIFLDGESHEALVIKLPDYGVMATGDVLYNGYHMVMNPNIPNWIEQIATLEAMGDYQLLLPGHGAPTDPSFYAVATEYLKTAQGFYEELDSGEEFKAAMLEAYPDAAVEFYLDLSVGALYPKSDQ
jgi:glyoxylase-like metal-dependent hydrolase (beta-lactamase superfamily II)